VATVVRTGVFRAITEVAVDETGSVARRRRRYVAVVAKMGLAPRAIFNRVLAITMDRDFVEAAVDEVALHP
jgi:hypothetical protein